MPREQGIDYLGDDGVVIADDAGEERFSLFRPTGGNLAQANDQVVAEFVLDAAGDAVGGVNRGAELT